MPELDQYDPDDIDDGAVDQEVGYEEAQNNRLRAERELDRRDAQEGVAGRRQRLPGALEGTMIWLRPQGGPLLHHSGVLSFRNVFSPIFSVYTTTPSI